MKLKKMLGSMNTPLVIGSCIFALSTTSYAAHYPDMDGGGNRWLVTTYADYDKNHSGPMGFQIFCFREIQRSGTHKLYEWFAPAYPFWRGNAGLEGDQVELYGGYGSHRGSSAHWELVSGQMGTGQFKDWQYPHINPPFGKTYGFYNVTVERIGYCYDPWPSAMNATGFGVEPVDKVDLWSIPNTYIEQNPELKAMINKLK